MEYSAQSLSPVPIVDLANIDLPRDGWAMKRNSYCNKRFRRGDTCAKFYRKIAGMENQEQLVQCPFGFSCFRFNLAGRPFALTCFIPAPRQGGEEERVRSRDHPEAKIGLEEIKTIAANLNAAEVSRINAIDVGLKAYPSALHEIRKYNRTIKQESERLCFQQSPGDADQADPRLVSIFKCSELMTLQFEVLELIANESLVNLPANFVSEIYRVFDMCVRVYRDTAGKKNISLKLQGDSPRARVNDKTFPIIATVLLENAIKYSIPRSEIIVRIQNLSHSRCRVAVNNLAYHVGVLPDIFAKGVSGSDDGTGQGYGLFLAQQVAKQHSSVLCLERKKYTDDIDNYIFSFELNTVA